MLNQTSRLLFYFSSSPLPALPCTNLLCAFPPSCVILLLFSFLPVIRLPSCLCTACSPTDMREWPFGPSGVKWYKVIGRSSLLTGWPLKGLLEGANQVLLLPPKADLPLPSSSAACVTWPGRGVRGRMINDAFSTCLEWSCPHRTVITHSQAAAAQHNCFLFVDLVYWGERWLWLGKMVQCTVYRGEDVCMFNIWVTVCVWDPCKLQRSEREDVNLSCECRWGR